MKTEILAELEKVLLNFMDSKEMEGEYYTIAEEERMLANIVADVIETIDRAYETGLS